MIRIRQVANLLGYREPQILEVFKNTLPTKLYWILFPIEGPRQAVDTVKRILTKEKLDKQLTGQTSTSQFLSVRDGTDRRVSFNTKDELEDKIDKLTVMMSKLAAKDNHERKPFKLEIYKSRGQNRSYGQGGHQNRSDNRCRGHFANNSPRQNYRGNRFRRNSRGYVDRMIEESTGIKDIITITEIGVDQEKGISQEKYNNSRDRSSSNSRSRSGSRASTNRDRIRCYACREYDHFARDCTNSREESNLEQLQQMLNMEEEGYRTEFR